MASAFPDAIIVKEDAEMYYGASRWMAGFGVSLEGEKR
jgi:hypothetical protein